LEITKAAAATRFFNPEREIVWRAAAFSFSLGKVLKTPQKVHFLILIKKYDIIFIES